MEHTQPPQQQQMQPGPQQQQSFHDGQNVQNQSVRSSKWEASLCNCSPCDSCLLGTFLPCMRTHLPWLIPLAVVEPH